MIRRTFLLVLLVQSGLSAIVTKCCSQRKTADNQPCISYDSSVMAESIDEAMFTFPNLASPDQATLFKAPRGVGGVGDIMGGSGVGDRAGDQNDDSDEDGHDENVMQASAAGPSVMTTKVSIAAFGAGTPLEMAANGECPTYACMSCKMALLNGFLANPNLGAADNATMTAQRNELALRLGTTQGSCSQTKRRKRANESTVKKEESEAKKQQRKKRLAKRFVLMNTTPDPMNDDTGMDSGVDSNTIDSSTTSSDTNSGQTQTGKNRTTLGVVTSLGCQYRRGEALETNSAWCGLCNLCWQWRKLPSDYYPNYLNEVNCDHNDDGCLSGFGECKPMMRTINVMRKKGEEWVKESIETTAACECQVEIGSSLHGLVVK